MERFEDALREVFFVVRGPFFFLLESRGGGGQGEGRRENGEVGVG